MTVVNDPKTLDSYDAACNLIRRSLDMEDVDVDDASNIDLLEEKIPMFKWMYRNNVDRDKVKEWLDILVLNGSLSAAKTIVELRFNVNEEGGSGEAFRAVSRKRN